MPVYKFENNAEGKLENAIGAGDTSIELETGDGALFPTLGAGEQFLAIIIEGSKSEWITVTDRAGDILTATRSGSPQSFDTGAAVELRMSGEILELFFQKGENRVVTEDPAGNGSLAANYFGEEVYNSVNGKWWKHKSGTAWLEMGITEAP
jgi:frataxin-like iron-binding protein CyaY